MTGHTFVVAQFMVPNAGLPEFHHALRMLGAAGTSHDLYIEEHVADPAKDAECESCAAEESS
jgi:hypothetical protein